MSGSSNMNIMRSIRLQMKSGYMKSAPEAYTFLRRYPPLNRDTALPVRKVETRNIPYLHLYEKVQSKNPLYSDEKVYPAYWAHEPQAMTLAKKWYEFQQTGMEEKEAYEAALSHIETLENESYTNLKNVLSYIKERSTTTDVRYSWFHDEDIKSKIDEFKAKIADKNTIDIEAMDILFQAELDYFIQTSILKWNEVERERRMRDPLFVNSFTILRNHLMDLGTDELENIRIKKKLHENIFQHFDDTDWRSKKRSFAPKPMTDANGVAITTAADDSSLDSSNESASEDTAWPELLSSSGLWRTEKPFLYEDYVSYFNQLKEQPYLGHWEEEERILLSHWIIDTLAYRQGLRKANAHHIQLYLDQLRAHFFPMVRYPKRAEEFNLPNENQFRKILYSNGIGYTRKGSGIGASATDECESTTDECESTNTNGKLFVRRFYRIPHLLFPKETLTTTLTADHNRLKEVLAEENGLLNEISRAGYSEKSFPELEQELRDFVASTQPDTLSSLSGGFSGGDNLSSLDALLVDDDEEYKSVSSTTSTLRAAESSSSNNCDAVNDDITKDSAAAVEDSSTTNNNDTYEWQGLVREYVGLLSTDLEKERDSLLSRNEMIDWRDAKTKMDFSTFKRTRDDGKMIIRSRLGRAYDNKEAARLEAEWRSRNMVLEELPNAELDVLDSTE
jgi:hypothetical protein